MQQLMENYTQLCSISAHTKNDGRRIILTQVMSDHIIETTNVTTQDALADFLSTALSTNLQHPYVFAALFNPKSCQFFISTAFILKYLE